MTGKVIFPFGRLENLELTVTSFYSEVEGVELDGVMELETTYGPRRYDLIEVTPEWTKLNIQVKCALNEDLLTEVMPEPDVVSNVRLIASVGCSATRYRNGHIFTRNKSGDWLAEITLNRPDVRGLLTIVPNLVRTTAASPTPGFASLPGSIVATGAGIELAIDKSAPSPKGQFEYRYEDFGKSSLPWLRERAKDVFYLDIGKVPRVYLNIGWPSLQTILETKHFHGVAAAMRKCYAATIAHDVWLQLLVACVASITITGEDEVMVSGEPWREDIAHLIAKFLHPEDSIEEALAKIRDRYRDPAEASTLISQLGSLAHELTSTGKLLDQAARHVESSTFTSN